MLKVICCIFIPFIFASCSKRDYSSAKDSSTLREEALILESRITWAKELDDKSLSYESSEIANTDDPVLILLSTGDSSELIYPSLPDFTVLDTSAYNIDQKATVDNFCSALVKNKSLDSFIMNGYIYSLVLFRYNLEKEGINFSDITDYVLGKPFINENECQCPVRFYLDKRYLDVNLYIAKSGQNWKINQIEYKKVGDR